MKILCNRNVHLIVLEGRLCQCADESRKTQVQKNNHPIWKLTFKGSMDEANTSRKHTLTIISHDHIPVHKAITLDHARSVGNAGAGEHILLKVLYDLKEMKRDVINYGRNEIKRLMYLEASKNGMKVSAEGVRGAIRRVSKYSEISQSWVEDSSMENAEKLFNVMYAFFDLHPQWAADVEKEYMDMKNLAYAKEEEDFDKKRGDKGCIARIIRNQKTEMIKLINYRGEA